jgi:CheY-like chemotaxis protein
MESRKTRILIVDDETSFTRLLKHNLEELGPYDVREVHTGGGAVAAAVEFQPDLILLDIIMPDRSGYEVAAQLKANAPVSQTPVVFLTATVLKDEAGRRSDRLAGYPVLAKPVSVEGVIECIEEHVGPRRPRPAPRRETG